MSFTVYPAIDVRDGRVVRLRQGDYAQETRYNDAPLALARRHAEHGAHWLHLVDLDAARAGGYTLAPLLQGIKSTTQLRVQTGGGVRNLTDVEAIFAAGADRVVIGSLAIRDPERVCDWLKHFGADRITVALDVRNVDGAWQLPIHGWTTDSGVGLEPLLDMFAGHGLRHLLCTDITRDGMMSGPNIELYQHVLRTAPGVKLQASGGVRGAADVRAARAAGCAGAVVGKALLDDSFELADALKEAAAC
jgi:phosphoribosylformimino-5-aminoimidazole carboxamide ribotide isomerase